MINTLLAMMLVVVSIEPLAKILGCSRGVGSKMLVVMIKILVVVMILLVVIKMLFVVRVLQAMGKMLVMVSY